MAAARAVPVAHPTVTRPGWDAISRTYDTVGDAWSWLILREALIYDVRRFADFQSRLGIARSTLASRLAQLTTGGLLFRPDLAGARGAEYHPTDTGHDFLGCLMTAMTWGNRWYFGAESTPLRGLHLSAGGHDLQAVMRCSACQQVLHAREVEVPRSMLVEEGTDSGRPRRRAPGYHLLERGRPCPIARTLTIMGDWWSALVLRECFWGTHRFDDVQSRLGVATNILSNRLSRLVEQDILAKEPYQDRPARYAYRLTAKGLDLYHVPLSIIDWGERWLASDRPSVPMQHVRCGHSFHPELCCGQCGMTVERREVGFSSQ